jgi:hypothetical protein
MHRAALDTTFSGLIRFERRFTSHFPQMSAARRTKKLDMVFVIDATHSTNCVLSAMKDQAMDTAFNIHMFRREVDDNYGVIVYRDPVDMPTDRNEFFQLTSDREAVADFLGTVTAYGGGDDPEDWVGALRIALEQMRWRDGKKCLFWIADANAHGSDWSLELNDHHNAQGDLLAPLIEEVARRGIYFIALNIRKWGETGCEKSLARAKEIYEAAGGPSFVVTDYEYTSGDRWDDEAATRDNLGPLKDTINATLTRQASIFVI